MNFQCFINEACAHSLMISKDRGESNIAFEIPNLTITTTRKGALMMKLPGKKHDAPIGITAHTDTLGLMVKEIKSKGASAVFIQDLKERMHDCDLAEILLAACGKD